MNKSELEKKVGVLLYENSVLAKRNPEYKSYYPVFIVWVIGLSIGYYILHIKDWPEVLPPTSTACEDFIQTESINLCKEKGGVPIIDYSGGLEDCVWN